jgi:hypothetical protein
LDFKNINYLKSSKNDLLSRTSIDSDFPVSKKPILQKAAVAEQLASITQISPLEESKSSALVSPLSVSVATLSQKQPGVTLATRKETQTQA